MGYCIDMRDSKFVIKRENFKNVLDAVSKLMTQTDKMGGGSSSGERWYAWVTTSNVVEAIKRESIRDLFSEWRYPVGFDDDGHGDIYSIYFSREKLGDEEYLFRAIAPWVENGSYIEMGGEDGAIWRWVFENGKLSEKTAKMVWE